MWWNNRGYLHSSRTQMADHSTLFPTSPFDLPLMPCYSQPFLSSIYLSSLTFSKLPCRFLDIMLYRFLLVIALACHAVRSLPAVQLPSPATSIDSQSSTTRLPPSPADCSSEYAVGAIPGVTFPVPKSWAGELPIGSRYGNNSLFFWLWQAESQEADKNLISE